MARSFMSRWFDLWSFCAAVKLQLKYCERVGGDQKIKRTSYRVRCQRTLWRCGRCRATRALSCWGWQTAAPSGSSRPCPQTAARRFWSRREACSTRGLRRAKKTQRGGNVKRPSAMWTVSSASSPPCVKGAGVHSPSSCAAVNAPCKPLSSMTEQLLLASHIVPTSATPSVSQLLWPHMSYNGGKKNPKQKQTEDTPGAWVFLNLHRRHRCSQVETAHKFVSAKTPVNVFSYKQSTSDWKQTGHGAQTGGQVRRIGPLLWKRKKEINKPKSRQSTQ